MLTFLLTYFLAYFSTYFKMSCIDTDVLKENFLIFYLFLPYLLTCLSIYLLTYLLLYLFTYFAVSHINIDVVKGNYVKFEGSRIVLLRVMSKKI